MNGAQLVVNGGVQRKEVVVQQVHPVVGLEAAGDQRVPGHQVNCVVDQLLLTQCRVGHRDQVLEGEEVVVDDRGELAELQFLFGGSKFRRVKDGAVDVQRKDVLVGGQVQTERLEATVCWSSSKAVGAPDGGGAVKKKRRRLISKMFGIGGRKMPFSHSKLFI